MTYGSLCTNYRLGVVWFTLQTFCLNGELPRTMDDLYNSLYQWDGMASLISWHGYFDLMARLVSFEPMTDKILLHDRIVKSLCRIQIQVCYLFIFIWHTIITSFSTKYRPCPTLLTTVVTKILLTTIPIVILFEFFRFVDVSDEYL